MPAFGPAFSEGAAKRRFAERKFKETQIEIQSDEFAFAVFGAYAVSAMADPKAPLEIKAMGPVPWSYQVLMMTTFLYWMDPLGLRQDAGLDESYTLFKPVRTRVDRIIDPIEDWWYAPAPTIWDFW